MNRKQLAPQTARTPLATLRHGFLRAVPAAANEPAGWGVMGLLLLGSLAAMNQATAASANWRNFAAQPDAWFQSAAGQQAVSNVLSWQSPLGGWPKNQDATRTPYAGDAAKLSGTFDNGATTGELRFLARAYTAGGDARCQTAVLKGLDHILTAQYPTGGWPQRHPPGTKYHRHITYNDGTLVRLLELLQDVSTAPDFRFVDEHRQQSVRAALRRGVECIVRCQIRVDGHLTAWCAQHDELDLSPRAGRAYELVSLSGSESAGILAFLMTLESPSPEVVRAIEAGAAWFAKARLTGIRLARVADDRVVVPDTNAPPLWARFYEIGSNRPIFCGRDGDQKYSLAEIERERRNGYAWYGNWGDSVARQYAAWQKRRVSK